MRERMERLVLLPFTIGCVSESSIAVGAQQQQSRRSKSDSNPSPIRTKEDDDEEEEGDMKNSLRSLALSKPNISIGINRLFKGFKTVSQLFVYKDEMDNEEEEMNMEIGCPTDVKHVTHIGLDGSASASATATATASAASSSASAASTDQINKGSWDDLISPVSWRQFELPRPSQPVADAVNVNSMASLPLHQYLSKVNYGMRDF